MSDIFNREFVKSRRTGIEYKVEGDSVSDIPEIHQSRTLMSYFRMEDGCVILRVKNSNQRDSWRFRICRRLGTNCGYIHFR